jgi:2Fe-2S ferredoxin
MKLHVTDLAGVEHTVEARLNWTVMEVIRDADLPMRAECGGSCACATCHVFIAPEWQDKLVPATEEEHATLEGALEILPNSRLSCQVIMTPELDGLKVTLSKDAAL